jgi:hypothetical protein
MLRSIARILFFIAVAMIGFVATPQPASSGTTGGISGRIIDDKGVPIAGARVSAASLSQSSSATSDAKGYYSILNLSPDTYGVTASKDGFDTLTISGFTVQADQTTRADFALSPSVTVLGHVTASAAVSVVNRTVTGDLYAVNSQAINA